MGLEKELANVINDLNKGGTKPYDTSAVVTRVEGTTAWVHIDQGVEETPVEMTIACKAGDTVKVRLSGGMAYLLGNNTAPPTDDRTALEALGTAGVARRTATGAAKVANTTEQRTRPAITSMTTYFKLSSGTPAQPTEEDHAGWSEEEPLWDPDSDEQLYYSVRSRTVQGVITWTNPHVLSSYANIAILQNAILLEVGDGSALAYIDDNDGDHILDNTGDPILANIGSIRDAYSYVRVESDRIRSEVSETYVSKGNSQIESLSSVMEQTASGLDIYSTVNGSVQDTHAHIDNNSFDIVDGDEVVASFGAVSVIGNPETGVGYTGSYATFDDSGFTVRGRETMWGSIYSTLSYNQLEMQLSTEPSDFQCFEVTHEHLLYGGSILNFEVKSVSVLDHGRYRDELTIVLGTVELTASELAALKALIS